ncbi:MAG: hypothetical protein MR729_10350 [Dorea sp.]|nr:hypothetical protein [Dorea sp.]
MDYHNLPEEWCKIIEKYEHLSSKDTLYIECIIDDPSMTDEDRCMYELCQTILPDHPVLQEDTGSRWLSKTGNQLDERPILDIYRNVGDDGYMEIDICFPLK